jgi:hypothetical protein
MMTHTWTAAYAIVRPVTSVRPCSCPFEALEPFDSPVIAEEGPVKMCRKT